MVPITVDHNKKTEGDSFYVFGVSTVSPAQIGDANLSSLHKGCHIES